MLAASDIAAGAVPYGLECELDVLKALPANTLVRCLYSDGTDEIALALGKTSYWGTPQVESAGRRFYASILSMKVTSIIPVTDQVAFARFPVGQKVLVNAKHPATGWLSYTEGVVVSYARRRVRVQLHFHNGVVLERLYRPSQLSKI